MKKRPRDQLRRQPVTITPVPRSRVIAGWLAVSFVLTVGTVLLLAALGVRFGEGFFAYRYSPLRELRSARALGTLVVAALAGWGVRRLAIRKRWGLGLVLLGLGVGVVWIWWAPPNPIEQHAFNLRSMSSDGAFVTEAEHVPSIGAYLRTYDERLKRTPGEMGGTRILSNPAGMTALTYGVLHAWPTRLQPPGPYERWIEGRGVAPGGVQIVEDSLKIAMVLCALWGLACIAAYFLGRLYLSPAGAAVFAIVACFNPMTVHFVPGKDPAQLLTINLMLLGWLTGWEKRSWLWAAFGGAIGVIGTTVGLIHIWVALALVAATVWEAHAPGQQRGLSKFLMTTASAFAGAVVVLLAAYFLIGWDIIGQTLNVFARFQELQPTFTRNRLIWFAIGFPSFGLFTSPGLWALVGVRLRRGSMRFGSRLALCTLGVMLATYLMGVTYELPRLWVAFLPSLTLGLAMDLPLLRSHGIHPRVARAIVLIVTVQILSTGAHWTVFDVREAEYRLLTKRLYQ